MKIDKRIERWRMVPSFVKSFLSFFIFISFVVTCSFLLFLTPLHLTPDQIKMTAPYTLFNIIVLSLIFVIIDHWRYKIMIDRPIKRIKEGLNQIMAGDLDIRLKSEITDSRYHFEEIIDSINLMTQELSSLETLRTDFIANVSHELKTPLSVIQNYGTILESQALTDQQRRQYGKEISETSTRLAGLITNILKLNRLENQQIYPEKKVYNLGEQICECMLMYEASWEKKDLILQTDIEEEVMVKQAPELLELVWNNLFSNAIKFTDNQGTVSISLQKDKDKAVVKISDTGCGISSTVGQHIFEKFYQGDTSHATQGNGLGLALVKRIIDIVDGEISVSSVIGEGTTFKVVINCNYD